MKMGEDGGDGPAVTMGCGRPGTPSSRIQTRQQELIHGVVDRVDFQQYIANLNQVFD